MYNKYKYPCFLFLVFSFSNTVGGRRLNVTWSIGGMRLAGVNPISAMRLMINEHLS